MVEKLAVYVDYSCLSANSVNTIGALPSRPPVDIMIYVAGVGSGPTKS